MKFRGYTFLEQIIAIILIGILSALCMSLLRPKDISKDAFIKISKHTFIQIEFATKSLLAKNTNNYTLTRLVDGTGEFSIASTSSLSRLVALYKNHLVGKRNQTLDATYGARVLTNGTSNLSLKPSNFTGFIIKNGGYFGIKLHGNCTTTVDYIYDPSTPDVRTRTNTCGVIFLDVNEKNEPNLLGVDQYIVAIGKYGVK